MTVHPDPAPADPASAGDARPFVVYWRPGCGFCSRLMRQMARRELDPELRNIWEDPEARRWLGATIGNETVPTVVVGERVMVNPSVDEVLAALAA